MITRLGGYTIQGQFLLARTRRRVVLRCMRSGNVNVDEVDIMPAVVHESELDRELISSRVCLLARYGTGSLPSISESVDPSS